MKKTDQFSRPVKIVCFVVAHENGKVMFQQAESKKFGTELLKPLSMKAMLSGNYKQSDLPNIEMQLKAETVKQYLGNFDPKKLKERESFIQDGIIFFVYYINYKKIRQQTIKGTFSFVRITDLNEGTITLKGKSTATVTAAVKTAIRCIPGTKTSKKEVKVA